MNVGRADGVGALARPLVEGVGFETGRVRLEIVVADLVTRLLPAEPQRQDDYTSPHTFARLNGHRGHDEAPDTAVRWPRFEPLADPAGWPEFSRFADLIDVDRSAVVPERLRSSSTRLPQLLTRMDPVVAAAFEYSTALAVTYHAHEPPSFAALSAHRAIFLNWRPGDGYPFLVEEFAHQGGHVLVTTGLFGREHEVFTTDPDLPVATLGVADDEQRSLMVLFHAVYTEAFMMIWLSEALDDDPSWREHHELSARLQLTAARFTADLRDLVATDALTDRGIDLVSRCADVFRVVGVDALMANTYDLSNQTYAFSVEAFTAANAGIVAQREGGSAPSPSR